MTPAGTWNRPSWGDWHLSLATDWIPGAIIAVVGSALSLWRGQAVMQARFEEFKAQSAREQTDLKKQAEKDRAELLAQIDRGKSISERTESALTTEIRDALRGLQNVATEIKVVSVEQAAFNRVTTKTLESVLAKVEQHDKVLQEHSTSLALLISGRKFE